MRGGLHVLPSCILSNPCNNACARRLPVPNCNHHSPFRMKQESRNMKKLHTSCWVESQHCSGGIAPQIAALQRTPQSWPLYPQESLSVPKGQARASKGLD